METFMKYEDLQIEEVCRLCLTKNDQMSLICESGVADMLLECASIQVTPDNGLFNLVCHQCANEVSRWYVFKQQIVRSFEIGRWLLEKKVKNVENAIEYENFDQVIPETHSDLSNSSSIIEDATTLQNLLRDYDDDSIPTNYDSFKQTSELKNVVDVINSVALNNDDDSHIVTSTSSITTGPKRKKLLSELICGTCGKQCTSTNSFNRHLKTHDTSRPFVCSKCDKSFKTSQVLAEHIKRHYDDRRHKCGVCGQKFYAKASLNDHMRSHTGERPFKCEVCTRAFATKAILRQHSVIHTVRDKKFQCDICSKFLLTTGSLETHKRKHTGVKPYSCSACSKAFFTKEAMQRHFGAIHDIDNNFLCKGNIKFMDKTCNIVLHFTEICRICLEICDNMKSLFTTEAKTYICDLVSVKVDVNDGFPQSICANCLLQLYQAHAFKKKIEESDEILRSSLQEKLNIRLIDDIDKKDVSVTTASGVLVKQEQKKGKVKNQEMEKAVAELKASAPLPNNTVCHLCKKKFSCVGQLTRHLKTHTGIRSYVCEACGKAYMESGSLRKHFLSKHSGRNKPYSCPRCGRGFDLRSTLTRHIRTHTGEKPFGCEICHKFYPSKSYLNKHKMIHLNTRGKSFICEICSKSFALKDGLKAHSITHTNTKPFQCTMCDKTFSKKGSLASHMKYIHTKEKNFMCQMCAKTFVTKCELDEHIRRHTGEKKEAKYSCLMCDKKLSSSTHLKLHGS
ncbi:hypothetical protein RN001_007984 [Aquatica leii]|uniref:Uncharacterized protein n=1 Tax=Aquatica leii TaxID=1421715 RepID=A0AAN7SP32_9COLE|nr:hypothetical protein RN001_007984 [Aquatica leii]